MINGIHVALLRILLRGGRGQILFKIAYFVKSQQGLNMRIARSNATAATDHDRDHNEIHSHSHSHSQNGLVNNYEKLSLSTIM